MAVQSGWIVAIAGAPVSPSAKSVTGVASIIL
jgi:hypothetical protein